MTLPPAMPLLKYRPKTSKLKRGNDDIREHSSHGDCSLDLKKKKIIYLNPTK